MASKLGTPNSGNGSRNSIKFAQINVGKSHDSCNILSENIQNSKFDIILVQEPPTRTINVIGFPRSLRVLARANIKPKTCIVNARQENDTLMLHHLSNDNLTTAQLLTPSGSLFMVSAYLPPHENNITTENFIQTLQNVIDNINRNQPVIIAGDLNAKSPLWGSPYGDNRGELFEEFIENNDLTVLNNNTIPTFQGHRGSSFIDVTLANAAAYRKINRWQIADDETLSEHALIQWEFKFDNHGDETMRRTRYNTNKADWDKFNLALARSIDAIPTANNRERDRESTQITATLINDAIENACKESIPFRKTYKHSVPWWTPELTAKRKTAKRIRRQYQRARGENREILRTEYARETRELKNLIRDTKTKKWKEFCTRNTDKDPWNTAYKVIRGGKNKHTGGITNIKKQDGTFTTDARDTSEHLLKHFFPPDDRGNDSDHHARIRESAREAEGGSDDLPITAAEINRAINRMNPKKAPGRDGLTADIIKKAFQAHPEALINIFNDCLRTGTFPDIWKIQTVKLIPKPNKTELTDPSSFRPICLLPVLGKILDRILTTRIEFHIAQNGGFHKNQYGFQTGKSTIDAISHATKFIKAARNAENYCTAISLDIKGAFDNAWWPLIIHKLASIGLPQNILKTLENYFENRVAEIQLANETISRTTERGCPQGSCSAPTLWKVLYDDVLHLALPDGCEIIGFADDTLLLARNTTYKGLKNTANRALDSINTWAHKAKLQFNTSKSEALFYGKTPDQQRPTFVLGTGRIYCKEHIKYLGVLIDDRLSWKPQIAYASNKGKEISHKISAAAFLAWGFNRDSMALIYKGAVEPAMLYAGEIWAEGCRTMENKKLLSAQRILTTKTAKAYRTISTEAACVISKILPVDILLQGKLQCRLLQTGDAQPHPAMNIGDRQIEKRADLHHQIHPARLRHFHFTITEGDDDEQHLRLYTDGSRMDDGRAGAAFVLRHGDTTILTRRFRLGTWSSIFQCEMLAIFEALRYLLDNSDIIPSADIITDSKSALLALQSMRRPTELQVQTRLLMEELYHEHHVHIRFLWIKAHTADPGNDAADAAARSAADDDTLPTAYDHVPECHIKQHVKRELALVWGTRWNNAATGRLTHAFIPTITIRDSIPAAMDYRLVQLITGHGNLKAYLHRIGKSETDTCQCGQPDTPEHVIFTCPLEEVARGLADIYLTLHGLRWPRSLNDITQLATERTWWTALDKFAKKVPKLRRE